MAQLAGQRGAGYPSCAIGESLPFAIAFAILLLGVARSRLLRARAALLAASVLVGAAAGEWLVQLLNGGHDGVAVWFTHALRWSVVSLAVSAGCTRPSRETVRACWPASDSLARLLPILERSEMPLGDEADLVYAYLSVIQIRMSERLKVVFDVSGHCHERATHNCHDARNTQRHRADDEAGAALGGGLQRLRLSLSISPSYECSTPNSRTPASII